MLEKLPVDKSSVFTSSIADVFAPLIVTPTLEAVPLLVMLNVYVAVGVPLRVTASFLSTHGFKYPRTVVCAACQLKPFPSELYSAEELFKSSFVPAIIIDSPIVFDTNTTPQETYAV